MDDQRFAVKLSVATMMFYGAMRLVPQKNCKSALLFKVVVNFLNIFILLESVNEFQYFFCCFFI